MRRKEDGENQIQGHSSRGRGGIYAEPEIQTIKGELVDLREDITEIKNFLKRICPAEPLIPNTKVTESEPHIAVPTVNVVEKVVEQREVRETQVPHNFKLNLSLKGQGEIHSEHFQVQFAIEHNTVNHCAASIVPNAIRAATIMTHQDQRQGLSSGVINNPQTGNPYGID